MKGNLTYSTILLLTLFLSCKIQQINNVSLCGTFEGVDGGGGTLSANILLELSIDNTCSLKRTFDLSKIECRGEWAMLSDSIIEISCNKNPILSDIEIALQSGNYIEETIRIKILSKNKLKMYDNTILRRKK